MSIPKYDELYKEVLLAVLLVIVILAVAVMVCYAVFFRVTPTIEIRNRTAHAIELVSLRFRHGTPIFYADGILPNSRTRGDTSAMRRERNTQLLLVVQLHGEAHRMILSGYPSIPYGAFRVNIMENDGELLVDVRYRRQGTVRRLRHQMEIPLD
ncbi:MAG: hypothetical protein FWB96_00215 [Defluviitaleaceae bacterium]|nr:hypothetical protein [Defluviitaleaceae bacterium]MCL2262534.1 hypothetical protein [Defluviitaleaceae bacterium]